VPPHVGRGGWTWYTGSAAWMYRVAMEYILGLRFQGNRLFLQPVIPSHWPGFEAVVRKNGGEYRITIENPDRLSSGALELTIDGVAADAKAGILLEPGAHQVRAILRKPRTARNEAPVRTSAAE
jgi:cyclic beta-1,2-glucan synthetase